MVLQDFIEKPEFYRWTVLYKNTAKTPKSDLDILAKATNRNCGILVTYEKTC